MEKNMNKEEGNLISIFAKSSQEAVGVSLNEWRGQIRIDIRIYVPLLEDDSLIPTKKGISLKADLFPQLLEAIKGLGNVMSSEKEVARIKKSSTEEIRIGVTTFKDIPLIYLRTYTLFGSDPPEWRPTRKGVSLKVDLYPKLYEAIEKVEVELKKLNTS